MTTARRLHYSYAQYLDALAMSELKLEFYDGDIFAMAGGTPEHGLLAAGLTVLLGNQLPAGCRLLTSDVKVRVRATGLATFPDLSVVCGELQRDPDDANAITNPALIVEVLSPSTEDYDRGEKASHYRQLPSLQAVLLVSHAERRLTVLRREGADWRVTEHRDGEEVELATPSLRLAVRDVYRPIEGL